MPSNFITGKIFMESRRIEVNNNKLMVKINQLKKTCQANSSCQLKETWRLRGGGKNKGFVIFEKSP